MKIPVRVDIFVAAASIFLCFHGMDASVHPINCDIIHLMFESP